MLFWMGMAVAVAIAVAIPVAIAVVRRRDLSVALRRRVAVDQAVDDMNDAIGELGHFRIVRDEQHRDAGLVELAKHLQDFDARVRIEIARRLVGQQGATAD